MSSAMNSGSSREVLSISGFQRDTLGKFNEITVLKSLLCPPVKGVRLPNRRFSRDRPAGSRCRSHSIGIVVCKTAGAFIFRALGPNPSKPEPGHSAPLSSIIPNSRWITPISSSLFSNSSRGHFRMSRRSHPEPEEANRMLRTSRREDSAQAKMNHASERETRLRYMTVIPRSFACQETGRGSCYVYACECSWWKIK